jgi:nucleotide-binding universal stress UspA family protein
MPVQFKKILAPTDFSPPSAHALEFALGVASPGSVVILCHVVDDLPLTYGYVGLAAPTPELRARMVQAAEAELERQLPKAPEGVSVQRRVLQGAPFLEIVRCAQEENADLIVMGTHGRSGLQQILIGSVTEKVVRKAPCPVLVVREKGTRFQHP